MGPKTLQEAIVYFAVPANCREYLVAQRWPDGVTCPKCGSDKVLFLEKYNRWHCREKHPAPQFTMKTGTVMEDSPIGLDKWLMVMWMVANCKNGISSWEIHRSAGITQKSAWFLLHRVRLAMKSENDHKMSGEGGAVEVDETYIGGKVKNMHRDRKIQVNAAKNDKASWKVTQRYPGKTAVMGILDRESRQVRAKVVPNVRRETLQAEILNNVNHGSAVFTDQAVAYDSLKEKYIHDTVNHLDTYVRGQVHTNGLENFWSLMKRNLSGTYIAVEPFHLDAYVDEQVFRFNNRATKDNPLNDADRFALVVNQIVGRRMTYKELTGKTNEKPRPF
jgi:transposase-like protein